MVSSLLSRPLSLSPSFLLLTLAVLCSYESNSNIFVTARINNHNSNSDNNNDGLNNIDDKTIPRDLSDGTTMTTTPIGGLGVLWDMDFPTFEFEAIATNNNSIENSDWNSKFRLTYTVNDMIEDTMFSATWWTAPNCKAGGVPLEQYGIGYEFEYESDGQPPGDGSSTREFTVAFRSAPSKCYCFIAYLFCFVQLLLLLLLLHYYTTSDRIGPNRTEPNRTLRTQITLHYYCNHPLWQIIESISTYSSHTLFSFHLTTQHNTTQHTHTHTHILLR